MRALLVGGTVLHFPNCTQYDSNEDIIITLEDKDGTEIGTLYKSQIAAIWFDNQKVEIE